MNMRTSSFKCCLKVSQCGYLRCSIQFLLSFTKQSTGQVQKSDFNVFQFQYIHIAPEEGLCLVHAGFLGWRVGKWYRVLPVPARPTSEMWYCCYKNIPQLLHEWFPVAGMTFPCRLNCHRVPLAGIFCLVHALCCRDLQLKFEPKVNDDEYFIAYQIIKLLHRSVWQMIYILHSFPVQKLYVWWYLT